MAETINQETFYCRVCHTVIPKPVFELKGVPAAAQFLPETPAELAADHPVDLLLFSCPACGILQHSAPPVPYYKEVVRASGISAEMRMFREKQFSDWIKRYNLSGSKILEVGCGCGEYLDVLRSVGVQEYGMEFRQDFVDQCRNKGLQVEKNFFETGQENIAGAPYDGFMILNFLEHLPNITTVLEGIKNNLSPQAVGLVEVPNSDMLFERSLLTAFSTEHIFYFTEETLKTFLQSHGFIVNSCKRIWADHVLSAEVELRQAPDLSGCKRVEMELRDQLHEFLSKYRKTAFWGAGHQTLTTLSVAGMTPEKICFLVDSSPAKQNRYTYATHIPIVSPDFLAESDAEAVIIACGGYAGEVEKYIRTRFGNRFTLAVLTEEKLVTL